MSCDYAGCPRAVVTKDGGWGFCRPHYEACRAASTRRDWLRSSRAKYGGVA